MIEIFCDHGRRYPQHDPVDIPPCESLSTTSLVVCLHGERLPLMFCDRHYVTFQCAMILAGETPALIEEAVSV